MLMHFEISQLRCFVGDKVKLATAPNDNTCVLLCILALITGLTLQSEMLASLYGKFPTQVPVYQLKGRKVYCVIFLPV